MPVLLLKNYKKFLANNYKTEIYTEDNIKNFIDAIKNNNEIHKCFHPDMFKISFVLAVMYDLDYTVICSAGKNILPVCNDRDEFKTSKIILKDREIKKIILEHVLLLSHLPHVVTKFSEILSQDI